MKICKIAAFLFLSVVGASLAFSSSVWAQNFEKIISGGTSGFFDIFDKEHEDPYDDSYLEKDETREKVYIYEEVNMYTLAKLYWAIGFLDPENNTHIDNYMKINECALYNQYSSAEFEWNQIRDATRKQLIKSKDDFSTRFQFVQPLKLFEYDVKRKAFLVDPSYQYKSVRRFEILASDAYKPFCSGTQLAVHEGYTLGIMLEMSRPFSLEYVPAEPAIAESYVAAITKKFRQYKTEYQTREAYQDLRVAYILFKAKIFAHGDVVAGTMDRLTQMLGALEGYEIYAEPELKTLLYSKSYVVRSDASKHSERLLKEFDILRDRSRNGGILTNVN